MMESCKIKELLKILAVAFAFSLFGSGELYAGKGIINIWTSSENVARALDTLTSNFEKDFAAKVVVTVLNKNLTNQFKTAAMAGKGPDILCWANDVIGELAESGLIEPIVLNPSEKKEFFTSALEAFTYNGKLYGYPYDVESLAMIRNIELLDHPIKSFEELIDWGKSFNEKNSKKFAFLFDIKSFYFNFPFLSAGGGYVFGQIESKYGIKLNPLDIGLANEGAVLGAKFLQRLVNSNVVPSSSDRNVAFDKMLKGQLALTIDGPWAISDLKKSGIKFSIDPLPTLSGYKARAFVGAHGFIVRRSSANKQLAKELIEKYLATAQGVATLYITDPRGSSRKDSLAIIEKNLTENDYKILNVFSSSGQSGLPMPNISAMGPVWSFMGSAFEQILQKNADPAKTLLQAKENIKNTITQGKKARIL